MFVKHFTIPVLSALLLLQACGRAPKVRTYTEVTQGIPTAPAPAVSGDMPSAQAPLPVGPGNMVGREGEVPPPPAASDLVWTKPAGWTELPGSGMRLAAFTVDGQAETLCTLIVLGGMAGSTEANVARWREQLGLPPNASTPLARLEGGLPFLLVDVQAEATAAGRPISLLGAIYEQPDRTIFLKFTAPTAIMDGQRAAFLSLARSLGARRETP